MMYLYLTSFYPVKRSTAYSTIIAEIRQFYYCKIVGMVQNSVKNHNVGWNETFDEQLASELSIHDQIMYLYIV